MLKRALKPPNLDEMLCFAVHSTGFAFNQVYREPLGKLGLTYPQYLVLIALWREDGVSVGRLGEQLALDTGTLTPLLKRLETMSLVIRRRSEADERRVIITLTDKGRALRHKASEVTHCVARSVGIPAARMSRLIRDILTVQGHLRSSVSDRPATRKRKSP